MTRLPRSGGLLLGLATLGLLLTAGACSLTNGVFGTQHLFSSAADHCDYCFARGSMCEGLSIVAPCTPFSELANCPAAENLIGERDFKGPLLGPAQGRTGSLASAGEPDACGGPATFVTLVVSDEGDRHGFESEFDVSIDLVDQGGDVEVVDADGKSRRAVAWVSETYASPNSRFYSLVEVVVCGEMPGEPIAVRLKDYDNDVSNVVCLEAS